MSTVLQDKNKTRSSLGNAITRSRGGTVLAPPVDLQPQVKTKGPVKDQAAFDKLRLSVAPTIEVYKRVACVAEFVEELVKQLAAADREAENGVWDKACDMMSALSLETAKLPQMFAVQRDAENECRAKLKEFNERLDEYRKLDPKQQDGTLLKLIDTNYQEIQKLITDKKFATALDLINKADKELRAAKVRAQWGDGGSIGDQAKKEMTKRARVAVEREEALAAKDLDARVKAETLGAVLGPEVRAILNEHRNALAGEVKSLKGYRFMDDVQSALDSAREDRNQNAIDTVIKDAKAIGETVENAKDRQQRMWTALKKVKKTNDNAEALTQAMQFAAAMLSHIPEVWQVDGPRLAERIPTMLKSGKEREAAKTKAMTISKEQRVKEAAVFKEVIEHGSLKGVERTQFYFDEPLRAIQRDTMDERAIKKAQEAASLLKEYQQLDEDLQLKFLVDDWAERIKEAGKAAKDAQAKLKKQIGSAPEPSIAQALIDSSAASEQVINEIRKELNEVGAKIQTPDSGSQYERLMKTYDEIIKRAYAIHDAGGTVADVESSLEHLPPEFWPPQFIENLQAWRKVERELAEERVAEIFAKKDKFNFQDARECFNLVMETYGLLGTTSSIHGQATATGPKDTDGWMELPDVASLIEGYINSVQSGFGNGEEAVKALTSLDFSNMPVDSLSKLYDSIAQTTSTFVSSVVNLKYAGIPEESLFMTEIVPVLSVVAAGIDLSVALNALRKAVTMRYKTGKILEKAKVEHYAGKMRDGGALVKAIKNERGARNRQVAKKTTDVSAKAVALSGEITKSFVGAGWGTEQAVGHGLVLTGKAIEYGGKIVFAGIDWGIAEHAKKLIKEAQAGNPIARLEIMENSGLYAKMYIAILAKEKKELALKFVAERGYDEQTVMKPAVSLKILREALLQHADQKDETQVSDRLGEELVSSVTGGGPIKAVKLVGKGAAAMGKKIKDLPKDKKIPYNKAWMPKTPASLSEAEWQTNKADCIKNAGLYDESTGIGKALKPCQDETTACEDALDKYKKNKNRTNEDRTRVIALVRSTQGTLRHAMEVIMGYYPGTNQGETHEPMAQYLVDIRQKLSSKSNGLEQQLHELGIVKTDWTPPKKPGTSAADWKSNWADAVSKCDLPEDTVVGDALATFEKTQDEVEKLDENQHAEEREKRIVIRDSLAKAGQALKNLPSKCSSFPGVLDYIDQMIGYVVNASQGNDLALNGFDWKNNPAKDFGKDPTCFGSAKWKATYTAAEEMGFCNSKAKDCGMEAALVAWEKHPMAIDRTKVDPKNRVESRKEAIKLLAKIAEAAEKLAKANPDSHTEFLKYIAFLRRTAHATVAQLQKDQDETRFSATLGTDTTSWERTYNAGIAAGAFPKDDKAYKELENALSSYHKVLDAMNSAVGGKKFKEAYANAQKAVAKAADVHKALSHVSRAEGWSNETLIKFLDFVRDEVEKDVQTGKIAQVLGGEKHPLGKQKFSFVNKGGWQEVKKAAVNAGLIADSKTGFGDLIDQYLKSDKKKSDAEKHNDKKPDVYKNSFNLVIGRLKAIKASAASMEKQTKNANLIAYFKEAQDECAKKIEELEKSRPA